MIQYQILQTNITRTVCQTVRRIIEILGVEGLTQAGYKITVQSTHSAHQREETQLTLHYDLILNWEVTYDISPLFSKSFTHPLLINSNYNNHKALLRDSCHRTTQNQNKQVSGMKSKLLILNKEVHSTCDFNHINCDNYSPR